MTNRDIHVLPTGGSWVVRSAEVNEASFLTEYDAETFGRRVAKEERLDFFVHDFSGKIRKQDSYGSRQQPV